MVARASGTFAEHGFGADGHKAPETEIDFSEAKKKTANPEIASQVSQKIGVLAVCGDYEATGAAVNISIDEVCCKRQTSQRNQDAEKAKEPKQVRNTVVHVQKGNMDYILVGATITEAVRLLLGFLLANNLLGAYPLTFFADAAKSIKNTVAEYFGFAPYRYILDWPHLAKKSAELLSSAIKGKDKRNEVHEEVKKRLWLGDVNAAVDFLDAIPVEHIKSANWLTALRDYLDKNRESIPCYAARKELGLRNSSNLGEKANDRVVSSRQKHNGMSWSKEGSFGLAALSAAHINNELRDWLHCQSPRFAFRIPGAA